MLERERQHLIVKVVNERSFAGVGDLVELLSASKATIRRDINALAQSGEIRRLRGGAQAISPRHQAHLVGMPLGLSHAIRVPQKRAIARAAAQLIGPCDSIIINGGATTFALVDFLAGHELDILTNSFLIAAQLLATSRNRITLPGGTILRQQDIVLSPFENDVIDNFWGDRLFTGCYGANRFGIMETDPLIVQAQRKLMKRSDNVIVMAGSSELRRTSSMIVAPLAKVTTLITDSGASPEELDVFKAAGIEVIVAAAAEETRLRQPASITRDNP